MAELLTVEADLQVLEQEFLQAEQKREVLRNNDPTAIDFQQWVEHDASLRQELRQTEKSLEVLQDGREDARCPTCMQQFVEHTPQHRIEHLNTWLRDIYPELYSVQRASATERHA